MHGVDVPDEGDVGGEGEAFDDGLQVAGEGADALGAHEELEAVLAVGLGERGGAGFAHLHAFGQAFAQAAGGGLQGELGLGLVLAAAGEEEDVGERGVEELAAVVELLAGVAVVVVVPGVLDGGAVRGVGLDEDLAKLLATTGATGDLDEELEGALGGAEVGEVEGEVGVEHADEGDVGEVEPFGDHLGADEEVDFLGAEVAQGVAELVLALHGVGVHAGDAGLGEGGAHDGLGALGAEAGEFDAGIAAGGAFGGREAAGAADVADEAVVGPVEGHGDAAVLALDGLAAGFAGEGGVEAAAVDEEDDLLAALEAVGDGEAEFFGEAGGVGGGDAGAFAAGQAHVHDADEGEFFAVGAVLHAQELVLAAAGVFEGLEAGGGAAEEDDAAFQMGAHDGDVPGLVTRRFLLLVGGLVLLIDDDEAEVFEGGKDGAAGADDDVGAAFMDFEPFVVALAIAEVAVEDGDAVLAVGETGFEALDGLRGEADFGDQDEGGFAGGEHAGDGLQEDLGFAAAGDAVQEQGAGLGGVGEGVLHGFQGGGLLGGEGERGAGQEFLVLKGVALDAHLAAGDPAVGQQRLQVTGGARQLVAQVAEHGLAAAGAEEFEDAGLHGGAAGELFEVGPGAVADEGEVAVGDEGFGPVAHGFGQHGAEDLADGGDVVVGDPMGELQQGGAEDGAGADDLEQRFEAVLMGRVVEQVEDDGRDLAALDRHEHAGTDGDAVAPLGGDGVVELEPGGVIEEDAGHA